MPLLYTQSTLLSVDLLRELVAKGYLYSHREFDYCPDSRIRARINSRCDGCPKINHIRFNSTSKEFHENSSAGYIYGDAPLWLHQPL